MVALCNRPDHYIFALLFLSSIYLLIFSSPNLSGRRLDVYHTLTYGVAYSANLECRSERCCTRLAASAGPKKSPNGDFWRLFCVLYLQRVCILNSH